MKRAWGPKGSIGMIKHNQAGRQDIDGLILVMAIGVFLYLSLIAKEAYSSVHNAGYSGLLSWAAAIGVQISPLVLAWICGFIAAIFTKIRNPRENFNEALTAGSVGSFFAIVVLGHLCVMAFFAMKLVRWLIS